MKNDVFKHQGRYQGEYERGEIVNGKPSWNNSVNAIWYTPKGNRWVVGNLIDLGHNDTMMQNMYAKNTNLTDHYWDNSEIGRLIDTVGRWRYWNGSKWNSPVASKDKGVSRMVSCKGTY